MNPDFSIGFIFIFENLCGNKVNHDLENHSFGEA
jgi:hypothetical protein